MRKIILAGNWKMNMLNRNLEQFFSELETSIDGGIANASERIEMILAVPATLMEKAVKVGEKCKVQISSQNIHWEKTGAFTGEISAEMIMETGVETTLIGHSERRQYFGETDKTVASKVSASLDAGLKIIACVGESQKERESGITEQVVGRQLTAILKAGASKTENVVIAYEPVWAIGTGLAATSEQAQEVHKFIRSEIEKEWGKEKAEATRILYGGSMKPENTKELLSQKDIDGGLIGGASLKPDSYGKMISIGSSSL